MELKSKPNCLIEIVRQEDSQVKVLMYDESGSEYDVVDVSDLKRIPLSIPILKSLGFEEREGKLMGRPYEHFWQKHINGYNLWIVDDERVLKLATVDAEAYFGVKFRPAPYLHELQKIIGNVDASKLYKDIKDY